MHAEAIGIILYACTENILSSFSIAANSQRQPRDRQKSASLSALDRRRKCSVIKLPPISKFASLFQ